MYIKKVNEINEKLLSLTFRTEIAVRKQIRKLSARKTHATGDE